MFILKSLNSPVNFNISTHAGYFPSSTLHILRFDFKDSDAAMVDMHRRLFFVEMGHDAPVIARKTMTGIDTLYANQFEVNRV